MEQKGFHCDRVEQQRGVEAWSPVPGFQVQGFDFMQMQADILGAKVVRPVVNETTALGAAYAAGLATGFWASTDDVRDNWAKDHAFDAVISTDKREAAYKGWKKAIDKSKGWLD